MCGIAGFQGACTAELLQRMSALIAHRGPDGVGAVVLERDGPPGRTGLVNRRLAIVDASSAGAQPMTLTCTRCGSAGYDDLALTYNGELYRHHELRAELIASGHTFHSGSDTEVLLHLYGEHGLDVLDRLDGIFAFALYDGRAYGRPHDVHRGDLVLARDPAGVKQLYHAQTPGAFVFASELKALLAHPAIDRSIDLTALHQHLAYLSTPAPRTLLTGVRKLEPGTALLVRQGRATHKWTFGDRDGAQTTSLTETRDPVAAVRELLGQALARQGAADVPIGAFLSGGIDSSAVVATLRRVHPERELVCYTSAGASQDEVDGDPADLPWARRVARHVGVPLREVELDASGLRDGMEALLWTLDEPIADPAAHNALLIAREAQRDGVKVMFSGLGGDELFAGYSRHLALRLERCWSGMPRPLLEWLAHRARSAGSGRIGGVQRPLLRRALRAFAHADLEPDRRLVSYFWWTHDALRRGLYTPELGAAVADEDVAEPLLETLSRAPSHSSRLARMLRLDARHYLADQNLCFIDKTGMACSIEVRVPLLDRDLAEYAARLPDRFKQPGFDSKGLLKRAIAPDLPREVLRRPKGGFGVPIRRWIAVELKDMVDDVLSPAALRSRGLFDAAAVRRLVALDRSGRVDGAPMIYALLCVELWCRQFVDTAVPLRSAA